MHFWASLTPQRPLVIGAGSRLNHLTPGRECTMLPILAPACLQKGGASFDLRVQVQSEDCLFLNVWTSTLAREAIHPVMVWIHGGGNLGGAGSEDAFDGAHLARQGVTVVTFNYRLGAFGFLAHPCIGANKEHATKLWTGFSPPPSGESQLLPASNALLTWDGGCMPIISRASLRLRTGPANWLNTRQRFAMC